MKFLSPTSQLSPVPWLIGLRVDSREEPPLRWWLFWLRYDERTRTVRPLRRRWQSLRFLSLSNALFEGKRLGQRYGYWLGPLPQESSSLLWRSLFKAWSRWIETKKKDDLTTIRSLERKILMSKVRQDWLHYVGRSFYSIEDFVHEARQIGISRRISWKLLHRFQWGDRIWLAQGDLKTKNRKTPFKGTRVFGFFILERVLFEGNVKETFRGLGFQEDWVGTTRISRSCGEYCEKALYTVTRSLQEIADALKSRRDPNSPPVVFLGGSFTQLKSEISLSHMGMTWGFNRIDPGFYDVWKISPDSLVPGDWRVKIDSNGLSPLGKLSENRVVQIADYQFIGY